ncbi:alpha/beta hydrolase, partial [Streptomyces globisporus]|uniref:alpha/beta fold hydrolase n=2 Tax=Streptomyces TaxID=1883 RepID=UPI0034711957
MSPVQNRPVAGTVVSADGTEIAYERSGSGPAVVLVASALADRADTAKLAALLAEDFTVVNYDRRGRGASGDAETYAV